MSSKIVHLVGNNVYKYISLGTLCLVIASASACSRVPGGFDQVSDTQSPTPTTANSDFLSKALEATPLSLVDTTGAIGPADKTYGAAVARYTDDVYELKALINWLPAPPPNYYYEGWIVEPSSEDMITIGRVERLSDGSYTTNFMATEDLTNHTQLVVSLETETDDASRNDPIIEGPITILN